MAPIGSSVFLFDFDFDEDFFFIISIVISETKSVQTKIIFVLNHLSYIIKNSFWKQSRSKY